LAQGSDLSSGDKRLSAPFRISLQPHCSRLPSFFVMAIQASMRIFAMAAWALALPAAGVGGGGLIGEFLGGGEHPVAHAHRVGHAGGQRMANLLRQQVERISPSAGPAHLHQAGWRMSSLLQVQRIAPSLDPASDEKFFKKDYPDDLRPEGRDHFQYPHPVVQDSGEYDKDYVKDENSDGGEWKAQDAYDKIRSKIAEVIVEEAEAKKKETEAKDEYEAAQKAESAAADKVKEAKDKEAEKKEKLKKAQEDAEEAAKLGEKLGNGTDLPESAAVTEAVKSVEKEMKDLENCKKQLADAQAKLKELMGESATAKEEQIKRTHDAEQNVENLEQEEAAEKAAAADALKKASDLQGETEKDEAAYKEAHKEYEADAKKLGDMKGELEKAEETLRRFRQSQVDSGGGVFRSGAAHSALASPLLIAALSVAVAAALTA